MTAIKLQDGSTSRDPRLIMQEQSKFYTRLYKSNPDVKFQLFNETNNQLTEEQKIMLDQEITLDELTTALNTLPCNKTPGLDGLTAEFYRKFWKKMGPIYLHSIQYSIRQGRLNETAYSQEG